MSVATELSSIVVAQADAAPQGAAQGPMSGAMTFNDDPGLLTKLAFIFSNEAEFYLDVHTTGAGGFPQGAIRGALPEPTGAAGLLGIAAVALLRRRLIVPRQPASLHTRLRRSEIQ